MKNEHLLPVNVIDLVNNFNNTKNENEKLNYRFRLEAIRDYCDSAIKKNITSQPVKKPNTRVMR